MKTNRRVFAKSLMLTLLTLGFNKPARATPSRFNEERWRHFSNEEKRRLVGQWRDFQNLPVAEQARLEKNYNNLMAMTLEEREQVRRNFARWGRMNAETQKSIRDVYDVWQSANAATQQKMQATLARYKSLTPEQRRAIRHHFNR